MLRIQELMTTGVVALRERDTVKRASEEMQLADIRHLPVIDTGGRVVGVLSNRDLARAIRRGAGRMLVGDLMRRDVITVHPQTPAYVAAEVLIDRKIGSLPVVNDQEVLVGIVTETDFLLVARQALHGRTGQDLLSV